MFKSIAAIALGVVVGGALAGCGNYTGTEYPATSAGEADVVGVWMSQSDGVPDARVEFADDGTFVASEFSGDLVCETNGIRAKTDPVDAQGSWALGTHVEREGGSIVNIRWKPVDSSVGEPCDRFFTVGEDDGKIVLELLDQYSELWVIFRREGS